MIIELIFLFAIILVGGFVQGVSGFGLGLVVMGFLPLLFTVKESALLVMVLLLTASLTVLVKTWRHLEIKALIAIGAAALIGRVAAFFVLTNYGDLDVMRLWLGIFLITMVAWMFLNGRRRTKPDAVPGPFTTAALGTTGGFIGGVFAVGGPFFVFYFLMRYKDKFKYNAGMQAIVVVTCLFSLTLHGAGGDFDAAFTYYVAAGIIATLIGTRLGFRLFEKLRNDRIRTIAMVLVFFAGINLVVFG
ncbi:sulfite exporter TauE/SafE family protein [Alteribacter natronophilus]|uniref:sulfite exporter TauE/SafE family protein n=1 Tax=Alteribacter natronophilus TaxID=2583810 RepID=UPI00110DAADD|nr:sulfite exporter TauE/SafE family protein [Alteribacter natronophilus]TMW71087.1 sulfite exporter TauE/SafE family protein [Alteribacter natronophilus]